MEFLIGIILVGLVIYFWNKESQKNIEQYQIKQKREMKLNEIHEQKILSCEYAAKKGEVQELSYIVDYQSMTISHFFRLEGMGSRHTYEMHRTFNREWFWREIEHWDFDYGKEYTLTPRQSGRKEGEDDIDEDWQLSEREKEEIISNREQTLLHWFPTPKKGYPDFNIQNWLDRTYQRCIDYFDQHPGLTPEGYIEGSDKVWTPPVHGTDSEVEESVRRYKELESWYQNRLSDLEEKLEAEKKE